MSLTVDQVLDVLKKVTDPDTEKDIVTAGYIKDLKVKNLVVSFILEFPKPKHPFAESIKKEAVRVLRELNPEIEAEDHISIQSKQMIQLDAPLPDVSNIIAVASGKGGVGKSTVAVNLSIALAKLGYSVGLLDADIYGPSVPKMFGVEGVRPAVQKIDGKDRILPVEKYGIKMLSIGFFIEEKDALVWRGPMATGALKQLVNDGEWSSLDYMIVDLPPGTGDIHLTLVQTLPVTGAVIVSTPQPVALADAVKGISMFTGKGVNVPVLGLVENMSWFTPEELPDHKYYLFGKEGLRKLAAQKNIPLLGEIPLVQGIREGGDFGHPVALDEEGISGKIFRKLAQTLVEQVDYRNSTSPPTQIVKITH